MKFAVVRICLDESNERPESVIKLVKNARYSKVFYRIGIYL